MSAPFLSVTRRSRGFSLVELMVGLVIGTVSILVVLQVFALSEGFKRTTTGGDDAQNAGAIALVLLQRDLRQAGYGLSSIELLGCNLALPVPAPGTATAWTLNALAPVTINHASIPAGDTNTDTLVLAYGSGAGSPEGDLVNVQPSIAIYAVATPTAFSVGDGVVAAVNPRPTPCNLTMERAVTVTSPSPPHVVVTTGVAGMANGTLFNMGPTPRVLAYAVRRGNLTVCDGMVNNCSDAARVNDPAIWVPIGDNVVSLRAQYGRDTSAPAMDGIVDDYAQTAPANACGWARVSALRLVVVTRSGQFEKTNVTAAAPTWAGAAANAVNLSSTTNWRRYRYKTFETTVPLRNMAWQGAQPGC